VSAARSDLGDALGRRVDGASLAVLRIAFGALLALDVARAFAGGWIDALYREPPFLFSYWGFGWVRPWPGVGLELHFALLGAGALAMALGVAYRASAWLTWAAFAYLFLLDKAQYLNHFYLIVLLGFLLALAPADRALSVRRRGGDASVPAWSVQVLRFQVGLVYLYAGLAKLNADWLRARPLVDWLAERSEHPVAGGLLELEATAWVFSYAGLAIDLLAWPLLAARSTRAVAFLVLVAFHLTNAAVFGIGIFPWTMIAATTVFFEPDWPRRLLRLGPGRAAATPEPAERPSAALLALLGAYCLVQVLVPLRHHLYPGNVAWTEEGHVFSWRMKLRSKDAEATFLVRSGEGGELTLVDPRAELTERQAAKMAARPDMILQYAHHLARRREERTGVRPEVYAQVEASLNGRPPQPLVDASVDLARERRGLHRYTWIVPLGGGARGD